MAKRRFMRQFVTMTIACGLIALIIWPRPVAASVDIVFFRAVSGQARITLEWETETETDFLGFYLYRSLTSDLDDADLISPLIPAQGLPPTGGAFYTFNDTNVVNNVIYYYWLGSLDNGQTEPHAYEGPVSATTLGGTTISTPVPTSQGSSPATATPTPSPSPTTNGTTATPTTRATTGAASPTATDEPEPSPTINLTPTRIPAGTFPQPPTPTRFAFSPTPGSQATPAANGGDDVPGNNDNGDTGTNPGSGASEPPANELTTPVIPITPLDGTVATTTAALPDDPALNPDGSVDVIGQTEPFASASSSSTDLLPPPGAVVPVVENERTVSPLLIMGLLVGTVFTFGGAFTTFFVVFRKR